MKNTVSITPVLIPPKFASFSAPQNIPPGFVNKLSHIENLNTSIIGLNRCWGERTCVWINVYGIRNSKKKKSHRMSAFSEKDVAKKLHFVPKIKAEAALEISKHFANQ